jgi:uncharacterized membrane protein
MATKSDNKVWYIIAYLIPFCVTGIIVLFLKGEEDKRLKLHAMQSIFLGILMIVISVVFNLISLGLLSVLVTLVNLYIWLYGLYVGFEASNDRDVVIPKITEYAKRYSGYTDKPASKKS